MKPRIGLNLDVVEGPPDQLVLNISYWEAILRAGGTPVLLPPSPDDNLEQHFDGLSGLILIGGKDYSPYLYGESLDPKVDLAHPLRQSFDVRLVEYCLKKTAIPLLGICAGHQLLNISLGGSLIQDIDSHLPEGSIKHRLDANSESKMASHDVSIEPGSLLSEVYGASQIKVTSSHHQAVQRLGKGLRVSARSCDGVIEAIELTERFFTIGVQWHPERDMSSHSLLFESFVRASASLPFSRKNWPASKQILSFATTGQGSTLLGRLDYPG
ncbi:MAG: gamma-glutamyl-gamma-aminobutyrate hydrolase family protein [Candidatus Melainabacteria bacterium]|nr:gamma-glutamyl-gamma-aminobutyrate hydrolase family protein [Candidatus Melainabacteria bacterium]